MIGAVCRSYIGRFLNTHDGIAWGTLATNISGSFALGAFSNAVPPMLTVIGVGGLGAYTTFSSFSRDSLALIEERRFFAASFYVGSTWLLCIGAAWLGIAIVK